MVNATFLNDCMLSLKECAVVPLTMLQLHFAPFLEWPKASRLTFAYPILTSPLQQQQL